MDSNSANNRRESISARRRKTNCVRTPTQRSVRYSLNRFDKSISLRVKNKERSSWQLQFLFTRAYFMSFRTVYLLLTFIYWFFPPYSVAIDEAREGIFLAI